MEISLFRLLWYNMIIKALQYRFLKIDSYIFDHQGCPKNLNQIAQNMEKLFQIYDRLCLK